MYIKKKLYGGIDYSDSKTKITQLLWNGNYKILNSKVTDCIAADMIKEFPYLDIMDIYQAILSNQKFTFPILQFQENKVVYPDMYKGEYENMGSIQGYSFEKSYWFGQVAYYADYHIEDIPDEQVCYLPEEQFYAYHKGVSLIQRFFHKPFQDLNNAQKYMSTMKKHFYNSEHVLLIHNWADLQKTSWYQLNMDALRLMEQKPFVPFVPDVRLHMKRLQESF